MGYVLNKDLVFTRAVKNTKLVQNIAPWIVRKVVSSGGTVSFIPESAKTPIAAKLRYS